MNTSCAQDQQAAIGPAPLKPIHGDAGPFASDEGLSLASARTLAAVSSPPMQDGLEELDSFGWDAEPEAAPAENDPAVWEAAVAIQAAISAHVPLDTWADWEDIAACLPETSSFSPSADDAEAYAKLSSLLLRAIREGSVPELAIEDLSMDANGAANPEAVGVLQTAINDLGAQTDERVEYANESDDFRVFIDSAKSANEEDELVEALEHVAALAPGRHDPYLTYLSEAQRHRLLTAEEEVDICQAMERGFELALDALAGWPAGISSVLAATQLVRTKEKTLRWLSTGPRAVAQASDSHEDDAAALDEQGAVVTVTEPNDDELETEPDDNAGVKFFEAVDRLSLLHKATHQCESQRRAIRAELSELHLTNTFLLELTDSVPRGGPGAVSDFLSAMVAHRRARDRMAIGNLKLVVHYAKKALYTGQPIADLIQEGNIGLLRAVDRFDWHRGYRFSTFATWWVRQGISRYAMEKCRPIRLPTHQYATEQRMLRAARDFEVEHGRHPVPHEISAALDIPVQKVKAFIFSSIDPRPLHEIKIDEHVTPDAVDEFTAHDPMELAAERQMAGVINDVLSTLKPDQAQVIRWRFGLDGGRDHTLEEIGARLEVTRERVRQIEVKALGVLRRPSRIKQLGFAKSESPIVQTKFADGEISASTIPNRATTPNPFVVGVTVSKGTMGSAAIDKAVMIAKALEIPVLDDRLGATGRIWFNFQETPDAHSRKLARKLIELGFTLQEGKGYWR